MPLSSVPNDLHLDQTFLAERHHPLVSHLVALSVGAHDAKGNDENEKDAPNGKVRLKSIIGQAGKIRVFFGANIGSLKGKFQFLFFHKLFGDFLCLASKKTMFLSQLFVAIFVNCQGAAFLFG